MADDWKRLYQRPAESETEPAFGYSAKAIDHFLHPRHVGFIENHDGMAKVGDPNCGDFLILTLKIDNADRIADIAFLAQGCSGAIATSSAVTELALGRRLCDALALTDDDIVAALGGLPEEKRHCSLLGIKALHAAITQALRRETESAQ